MGNCEGGILRSCPSFLIAGSEFAWKRASGVAVVQCIAYLFCLANDGGECVSTFDESANLESSLRENRLFAPPAEFSAKANIKSLEQYEAMYRRSVEEPEAFWAEAAGELEWFAPWTKVMEGVASQTKWFVGGKLNLSHNCVDRHALGARRDKVALLWEGEPGEVRRITYGELHRQVQEFANVLKGLGVKRGDRVAIYMGMTPELAIALLACARIGAVH